MWNDTCLLVTTDHGLLLGEHNLWGKNREAYYEEISHIPLFFHHPDYTHRHGECRQSITQTPDIMPTVLECFGVTSPSQVTGKSILGLLEQDNTEKRVVIFGMFGGPIGATDGEYVYYHYPTDLENDNNLYEYTLMPEHIRNPFSIEELKTAELSQSFEFAHGIHLLKIKALNNSKHIPFDRDGIGDGFLENTSRLYHLPSDPNQKHPLEHANDIVEYFKKQITKIMIQLESPPESFVRFGLTQYKKGEHKQ